MTPLFWSGRNDLAQMGHVAFLKDRRSHVLSHSPRSTWCHRTIHPWSVLLQCDGPRGSLIAHLDVLAVVAWSQSSEEGVSWSTRFLWTPRHGVCDVLIVLMSFGKVGNTLVCFVPDLDYLGDYAALEMVETYTRVTWAKESQG